LLIITLNLNFKSIANFIFNADGFIFFAVYDIVSLLRLRRFLVGVIAKNIWNVQRQRNKADTSAGK
jgi:hypothetical protein